MSLACAGVATAQFRSIDGSGNNPVHPDWGKAGTMLRRATACEYEDGLSAPAGSTRPSARAVSNAIVAQVGSIPSPGRASDFVWQWGQFIDHDLDLTGTAVPAEEFDIPVPLGDPFFDPNSTGTQVIPLMRSLYAVDPNGVRQQINENTAWIDASMVYGSDDVRAQALRAPGGKLASSAGNLMPFNVNGLPNAGGTSPTLFLAGDVRSNEQVGLTAVHTLFVREHNFWASLFGLFLDDESTYQMARMIVTAEIQAITYREFLPALLGPNAMPPYLGYDSSVDPTIETFFSTASYRFGHSMLSPVLLRLDQSLRPIAAGHLPLASAFFAPQEITSQGIDSLLRGLAHQTAQNVDPEIVDAVRNFLFGPPGAGGFDLAALNIQRGREHGLPDYNQARADYGLPRRTSFAEISSDPSVVAALASTYASVDEIDAWVGGLAEDHLPGALVGELVAKVLVDQFTRARDGDRFFYQGALPQPLALAVESQTLAVIIRRNTQVRGELQRDVFHVPLRDEAPSGTAN
jgi:hypothetical protein